MYYCYNRQVCPLQGFIVSAHKLRCPARPPPLPIPLVQTPNLNQNLPGVVDTTSQLISPHYLSSHPTVAPIHFRPLPPPFFSPFLVQTTHLKSKSATAVINTSTQLISRHYLSSHPRRSVNSSPAPTPPPPTPTRSPRPRTTRTASPYIYAT